MTLMVQNQLTHLVVDGYCWKLLAIRVGGGDDLVEKCVTESFGL